MCVKTIGAVSSALVDAAEQPAEKKSSAEQQKPKMNSLTEERKERLAREWVPHPTYWGGDPMKVPWLFPAWPEKD